MTVIRPNSDATRASEKADLRRGATQILSGFGVRIVARILLIAFVAKLYGVDNFGRLGETIAIIELTAALATFGLNKTLLGRLASKHPEREMSAICEALVIAGIVSALSAIGLWLLWPFIVNPHVANTRFAIVGIPLIALAEIALTATRHRRNVAWDTIVKAIVKPWGFLLLALAGYFFILHFGATSQFTPSQTLIAAYIASLAVSALAAFYALFRVFGSTLLHPSAWPNMAETLEFGRQSLPIAISETAVFAFRRIDLVILALVAGPTATGVYYLAQQVGTVVEKVRYLFEPMLAPIFAQTPDIETIGYHLRRLCLLVFSTQIAIIALFAILGGPTLDWLGSGFAAGLVVILVVLLGELFDGSIGLCELPMVYRNPAWPPRAALLALTVEIVLVSVLASTMGAVGAAMGFAGAMALLAIVRLVLIRRLYAITVLNMRFAAVLVIAGAAGAAAWFARQTIGAETGWAIAACAAAFAAVYGGGLALYLKRNGSKARA